MRLGRGRGGVRAVGQQGWSGRGGTAVPGWLLLFLVPPHSWCSPGAVKAQSRLSVEKLEGKKAGVFSSSFVEVVSLTSDTER